jgi:hypothetical protein
MRKLSIALFYTTASLSVSKYWRSFEGIYYDSISLLE